MARSREQVIELLGKLRNITFDNGATLEESKVAAAHVERLLAEHNLSMFDVDTKEFKEDVIEEEFATAETRRSQWLGTLASRIAYGIGCKVFTGWRRHPDPAVQKDVVTITFVGHEADASVARFLYETLSSQLYIMGSAQAKIAGRSGRGIVTFRSIFIENAAQEIGNRLKERGQMQETLAEATGAASACTAMVHVKTAAVDTYYKEKVKSRLRTVYNRGYQDYDASAAAAGRRAGQEVSLHRGELGGKTGGDRPLLT